MGYLFDLPKEAVSQGLQALDPLGDGSRPSGNDPLLTAQGDKCRVKLLIFPDGLSKIKVISKFSNNYADRQKTPWANPTRTSQPVGQSLIER